MHLCLRVLVAGTLMILLAGCANNTPVTHTPIPINHSDISLSLVANPTFATAANNPDYPVGWSVDAWGRCGNATFDYPVAGASDDFAATFTVPDDDPNKSDLGAADWSPNPVKVAGGAVYWFSDNYMSDAKSYLIAEWTFSDKRVEYDPLATLEPTVAKTWKQASTFFAVPLGAVSLVILHELTGPGTLTVDDYLLHNEDPPQSGLDKAVVSLTFDDGWETHDTQALPILASARMGGTFFIITGAVGTPEYVTQDELQGMKAGGELAAHTVTHPHLPQLALEDSKREFEDAAKTLASWGIDEHGFAYPYGEYDAARMGPAATR